MSKQFNYVRAWRELAMPAVESISTKQRDVLILVLPLLSELQQGKDLNIPMTAEVKKHLETLTTEELAPLSRALYYFGHWMPGKAERLGENAYNVPSWMYSGCGWKFSNVADQIIKERLGAIHPLQVHDGTLRVTFSSKDCWLWEEFALATPENVATFKEFGKSHSFGERELEESAAELQKLIGDKWDTEDYMDHEAGSVYTDEETAEYLTSKGYNVQSIIPCNFESPSDRRGQQHPFVIGSRHLNGKSMYIDPSSALCAECGGGYSQHTYKRAAILTKQPGTDPTATLTAINQALADLNSQDKTAKAIPIHIIAIKQNKAA